MAELEKIVKLTKEQYNKLANNEQVGEHTGLNDNYLYLVPDNNEYVTKEEFDEKVSGSLFVAVTYNELRKLRDSNNLTPGTQYRITDYQTTIIYPEVRGAGRRFDVIVTATDVDALSEDAKVTWHEGDTYFENSRLDA
jgi:hypothetical protein